MKIPKYWSKREQVVESPNGEMYKLVSWQWSDVNLQEAANKAASRLNELVTKVLSGAQLDNYGYGDLPLREEVTQSLLNSAGQENAVVTRNRYGALVLNTTNTMFIDIDVDDPNAPNPLGNFLGGLFGKRAQVKQDDPMTRIAEWSSRYPDIGMRVYRTAAGLRVLVTNQQFGPTRSDTLELLKQLKSDPLYIRLCRAQDCFRARLTPKPWRCGVILPPAHFPFDDVAQEARFRDWTQRYEQASVPYSVCRLVQTFGPAQVDPDIQPILNLHDQMTGVDNARPLA